VLVANRGKSTQRVFLGVLECRRRRGTTMSAILTPFGLAFPAAMLASTATPMCGNGAVSSRGVRSETATVATVVPILARTITDTLVRDEVFLGLQTILWN